MHRINFILLFGMIVCAGCGVDISSESPYTATPDFVTATLPPALTLPATQISVLPESTLNIAAEPTIAPIEGTTTTQLNIRSEPSTAGNSLGIILAFSNVQVIGREEYGKWYQIIYIETPNGKGWVTAEYVRINAAVEIPVVRTESDSGSGMNGLVIQGVNVRSGPATTHESLGTLIPNDVVFITGKDIGGAWMEIEFANAPNGKGWVASEFLQVNNPGSLPIIGNVEQAISPTAAASISAAAISMAADDGDSMQTPLASVRLSALGARILQFSGEVSSPDGDTEDWVQFTSFSKNILVEMKCSNKALRAELWNNGQQVQDTLLACGEKLSINLEVDQSYFLRIQAVSISGLQYIQYILKISAIE